MTIAKCTIRLSGLKSYLVISPLNSWRNYFSTWEKNHFAFHSCVLLNICLQNAVLFALLIAERNPRDHWNHKNDWILDLSGREVRLRFKYWLTLYLFLWITQGPPNVEKPVLSSFFTKSLFTHSHKGLCLNCLSFVRVCAEHPHCHLLQSGDHENWFVASQQN